MLSDRRTLTRFLALHCRGNARGARSVLDLVEPYCRKADAAMYGLAPAADVDAEALTAAIRSATDVDVLAIRSVSLFQGPDPLEGRARTVFWEGHLKDIDLGLRESLFRKYVPTLHARLGDGMFERTQDAVWRSIGEPLWHSFEGNRWDETGYGLRHAVRASLLLAIFAAVGCTVAGEDAAIETLRPLLGACLEAIPLGRRADTGAWLAITA